MIFSKPYKQEYKSIWKIAYPLVLGNAGHMITSIADTIMVGQLGSDHLAAASIAHTIFILIFVFGIGIANGLTPLVGKAYGEKDFTELKSLFKYGFYTITITGLIIAGIMLLAANVIPYLGQEPRVVELAVPYYYIISFSMIPYMVFLSYKQFADGMTKTKPGMTIIIICNIANVILNYLLIYGKYGFPELGLNGAAIATLISRAMMAICFIFYMQYNTFLKQFVHNFSSILPTFDKPKAIMKLGIPTGFQYVLEVGAFASSVVMTGWLGAKSLASFQIVMSICGLTYLMSGGVANASTVRISNLIGEGKLKKVRVAGASAFIMVISFMAIASIVLILGRHFFPSLYITEFEVIEVASKLILAAAIFQIMDGTQVTAMGSLRGMQDVKIPTYIAMLAYWVLMLPVTYFLGIYMELGVVGIWYGFIVGLFGAALGLFIRYEYVSRKYAMQSSLT